MKSFLIVSLFFSFNAFSQTTQKPDPNSPINAEEQIRGLPGAASGYPNTISTDKKNSLKAPAIVAPTENTVPANCADNLGGKGSATFTACEANKKTR